MDQILNIRDRTTKLFEENIDVNRHDLGSGTGFSVRHQKYKQRKKKINKLDFIKIFEWDFPGGSVVKNPPANAGDTG